MKITLPIVAVRLLFLLCAGLLTAPLQAAENLHLGVATCGNSTCHGSKTPLPGSLVEQNEFLVWSQYDKHSKSFAALKSDRGVQIADHLGLGAPERASECLGCHADNVPVSLRGKGFRLEDGVGCETCHGGASNWLGVHMTGSSTHAENVAAGMYPTNDPTARAKLCLGCHLFKGGEQSQHRYYAAGHPRLRFELDTYTEERPGHHKIDADYRRRKPGSYGTRAWVLGQAAESRKIIDRLLATGDSGLWPDYAVFACFGCHRKFSDGIADTTGVPPLQDAPMQMTTLALSTFGSAAAGPLSESLNQLNKAFSTPSGKGWRPAAEKLSAQLESAEKELRGRSEQDTDASALYSALLTRATNGDFVRHHVAEQATYALATLRQADIKLAGTNVEAANKAFDELFEAAGMSASFDPARWRVAAQGLATALPATGR